MMQVTLFLSAIIKMVLSTVCGKNITAKVSLRKRGDIEMEKRLVYIKGFTLMGQKTLFILLKRENIMVQIACGQRADK